MQHTPVTNTLHGNIHLMYTLTCCLISCDWFPLWAGNVCLKGNTCSSGSQRCQIFLQNHFTVALGLMRGSLITMNIQWKQITQIFFHFFFSTEGWNVESLAVTSGSWWYLLGKYGVFKFLMCYCCWFKCRSVLLQLAPSFRSQWQGSRYSTPILILLPY